MMQIYIKNTYNKISDFRPDSYRDQISDLCTIAEIRFFCVLNRNTQISILLIQMNELIMNVLLILYPDIIKNF